MDLYIDILLKSHFLWWSGEQNCKYWNVLCQCFAVTTKTPLLFILQWDVLLCTDRWNWTTTIWTLQENCGQLTYCSLMWHLYKFKYTINDSVIHHESMEHIYCVLGSLNLISSWNWIPMLLYLNLKHLIKLHMDHKVLWFSL